MQINKIQPLTNALNELKKSKRKYFGTDGIRGKVGVFPITADFILKLGWAIGKVLPHTGSRKVLIGKDTRISGYMFESALEAGLIAAGVDIHLLGPMPTPAIAYLTRTLRAQAGIVISASHNPYDDNGVKFFSSQGLKFPDEIEQAIEEQLEQPMTTVESSLLGKAVRIPDAPGRYIEFCKSTVSSDVHLTGLKIIVDSANGATYSIASNVFSELDADVLEIGVEPNGLNINENCGATHPEMIRELVLSEKADLGIALDGDGDRVIMVDNRGEILDGDQILYIIAKHKLEMGLLKGGVVGTVMSNFGLQQALKGLGVEFVRVPVGDRNIIAELSKRGWHLGGEPSGHVICSDAITTGDGIITALQILSAMRHTKKSLHEIKQGLHQYPQTLINVPVKYTTDPNDIPQVKKAIAEAEAILLNTGRILLRRSGTESLVRVMVEGKDAEQVKQLADQLAAVVRDS